MERRSRLVFVSDFVLSFMWVCSGVLVRLIIFKILGFSHTHLAEIVKLLFSIANMFLFAFLAKVSRGGAYNPLPVLVDAIFGDFCNFLVCLGFRIPAQVVGFIVGVKLVIGVIPEVGRGPRLNVDILWGALTEGLLTFIIVSISLVLVTSKVRKSFFMKTWISSLSKLTLHILGSNLTGGCMNPASVMAWTYVRGDHITKEHIFVYWIAPIKATILAVWTFKLYKLIHLSCYETLISSTREKNLVKFQREDPTFRVSLDPKSGQTIIYDMGEMHLKIYVERIMMEYNIATSVGKPHVNFSETIAQRELNNVNFSELVILEPIMLVELKVPTKFQGVAAGEFNKRKCVIVGNDQDGDDSIIRAHVPLNTISLWLMFAD